MRKRVWVRCLSVVVLLGLVQSASPDERWRHVAGPAYRAFDLSRGLGDRYWDYAEMMGILYEQNGGLRIVYVDARASGRRDGSDWLDAFHTIREAVDALDAEGGWIWAAEGEYHESVDLPSRVGLFGGFSGLEDDLLDRDITGHPTVLVGDGTRSVVTLAHLTVLDGFTIVNGGGETGAGVLTGDWLAVIRNNTIRDNVCSWSGGGILVSGGTSGDGAYGSVDGMGPVIERNLIFHNVAYCGSGITLRYSLALVRNNTMANNGGGDRARGMEIIMRTGSEPTVVNNILWNNGDEMYFQVGNTGTGVFRSNCDQDRDDFHEGIVFDDPQFADSAAADYRLAAGSACVDAGVAGVFPDPDGSRGDLGAFFFYRQMGGGGAAVRVESAPVAGVFLQVDGFPSSTPFSAAWEPGSVHRVRPASAHPVDRGTSYAFTGWNDGAGRVREIEGASSPLVYTARYGLRYLLEISGEPSPDAVRGEGWHFADSSAAVSAEPILETGTGTRLVFAGWTGTGAGSYTGDQPSFSTFLGGPVSETVRYNRQVLLTLAVSPDTVPGLRIEAVPAGPWFAEGASVTLRPVSGNARYRFSGWNSGTPNPDGSLTVEMNSPRTVVARFELIVAHPPVLSGLSDQTVAEDGSLSLTDAWISARIRDDVDPFASLAVTVSADAPLIVRREPAAGVTRIVPPADWNGSGLVRIRVQDPQGDSDEGAFTLRVLPVDDPPGTFRLVSPEEGALALDPGAAVRFSWTESANVDPGDTVRYRFTLDADSTRLTAVSPVRASVDTVVDGTSIDAAVPAGPRLYWNVEAFDTQGLSFSAGPARRLLRTSDVADPASGAETPRAFGVSAGFPNPFNPETAFEIRLPESGRVRLTVFDGRGAVVRTVAQTALRAGVRRVAWDGRDDRGLAAPSGVYTIRIEAGGRAVLRKATLIR
jgi:hypothetical protein